MPFDASYLGAWPANGGLLAFYYPDRAEPCDHLCHAEFLANFYPSPLVVAGVQFRNAEAAFQAQKFVTTAPQYLPNFQACVTGDQAFQLKRQLEAQHLNDPDYGGHGDNWSAMWAVLVAKFSHLQLRAQLASTSTAFLLEHNSAIGRDEIWSNNGDGSGSNWLGLQLMLLREEGRPGPWAPLLSQIVQGHFLDEWQQLVSNATQVLQSQLFRAPGGGHGGAQRRSASLPLGGMRRRW